MRVVSVVLVGALSILAIAAAACGGSTNGAPADAGGGDSGAGRDAPDTGTGADGSPDALPPADAGQDVDNGMPSTTYPAPHPPLPQLTNRAMGPVLTSPKVYLVFYPGYPYETDLATFAKNLAKSTYWATTTSEYGVGALAYGGTIELTGQTPPQGISSTDIQSWISGQIAAGTFGTPDPQAIYTVYYPQGTTITQPNPISSFLAPAKSCVAFDGYHDNAAVALTDGGAPTNYAYAVIATCGTSVQSLTTVSSHEWIEASTDPQITASGAFTLTGGPTSAFYLPDQDHLAWALMGGGEAGDLCEPEGAAAIDVTPQDVGYSVQRTWSNAAARASHDPCVPGISGAFFASAPVLPETVTFTSSITGSVTTAGITIPVGQSKTLEVDLFSDGDTGGPWTVTADDLLSKYYGSYGLAPSMSFYWDRNQGVNGEKLHLTITVTAASLIGGAHAFVITSTKGLRTIEWPGVVVE